MLTLLMIMLVYRSAANMRKIELANECRWEPNYRKNIIFVYGLEGSKN